MSRRTERSEVGIWIGFPIRFSKCRARCSLGCRYHAVCIYDPTALTNQSASTTWTTSIHPGSDISCCGWQYHVFRRVPAVAARIEAWKPPNSRSVPSLPRRHSRLSGRDQLRLNKRQDTSRATCPASVGWCADDDCRSFEGQRFKVVQAFDAVAARRKPRIMHRKIGRVARIQ